jgi:hypothetical protein
METLIKCVAWLLGLLKLLGHPVSDAARLEQEYQERYAAWAKELKELEDAEERARSVYRACVAGSRTSADALLVLHARWESAGRATGDCRGRQPSRPADRAE